MGEAVVDYLAPVRERYAALRADAAELEEILAGGADARPRAGRRDARRRARADGRRPRFRRPSRPSLCRGCPPPPSIAWSSTSTSSPGPFDLLLSLILREELDLLEVELADVVLAYLDHLEARDELDLEATTEFLVLIAALLELKSRLMLPGEEIEELDELVPAEAAEELLERMLRYARFRGAAGWLRERSGLAEAVLYRSAPLPDELRRLSVEQAEASYDPAGARRRARRPAAHAAAGRPQPHGDPARHARRAPRRSCASCCGAAPSTSTRRSATPTA